MARITELEEDIANANVDLIDQRIKILALMKDALVYELTTSKKPVEHKKLTRYIHCIESAEQIIAVLTIRFMPR